MSEGARHDPHEWFRARLDAHALGLLDDDEEGVFLEHAESCAECGAIMKAHRENSVLGGLDTHIPSRTLARWNRAQRLLRGMPRRLVREHLERCSTCRQDLEILGFLTMLEKDEALEGDGEPASLLTTAEEPAIVRIIVDGRAAGSRWGSWLAAGAVGAGLAAAATLLVIGPHDAGTVGPQATRVSPPAVSGITPLAQALALDVISPAVALRGASRGQESAPDSVSIPPGARYLHLALPDLFLPDSATVEISLLGPDGARLISITRRYGYLAGGRTLLLERPQGAFEPGVYEIVVRVEDAGTTEPEHRFRLKLGSMSER